MSVSTRNKTAAWLAIIGGILILIGGGTGMVDFLNELKNIIENWLGESNETLELVFWILIFVAALGGVAVMIGGFLISKNKIIAGKILIALGAGIGFIGLIIGLIVSTYHGEEARFFAWITTSFLGFGILLSIIARFLAKRSSLV
jgi:hypothetical protein